MKSREGLYNFTLFPCVRRLQYREAVLDNKIKMPGVIFEVIRVVSEYGNVARE